MADTTMFIDHEPLIMGMTPKEYQAAFSYLDHANFTREVEEYDGQRRETGQQLANNMPWYGRPEYWALILGCTTLLHTLFIQWVWPLVQKDLPINSPWASPGHQQPYGE
ncbi:hypothetical protein E0Z10_g3931 [Xylaria hypoxylon]|uniref:Uncharacterized protein n=1 Tax=Xylaria hypoxylon TaxID=37992 RepID=A0A4Z0Z0H9_9PEZI|nr:hypothetical protein E0Z10_g3931 [Xylaria hypoxylon]